MSDFPDTETPIPCQETDPEIFFTDVNGASVYTVNTAISICQSCGWKTRCLNLALSLGDVHGIWGGATRNTRRKIAKERGIVLSRYYSTERGSSSE